MERQIIHRNSESIRIRDLFEEGSTENERKERERLVSARSTKLLREIIKWVRPNIDYVDATRIANWFKYRHADDPFPRPCEFLRDEVGLLLPILSVGNDDVTFADDDGQTVLHLCILHYTRAGASTRMYNFSEREKRLEDAAIVRKFVGMGASAIARDRHGKTPLGLAIEKQRIDLVRAMLKCLDPELHSSTVNDHEQTVLRVLTEHCDYDGQEREHFVDAIARWSKPRGALTRADRHGLTPLHMIVKHFHVELLEIINDYGYDMHCHFLRRTSDGDDLLLFACKHMSSLARSKDHLFVIEWLLRRGCRAVSRNREGFDALHYALRSGNLAVICSLMRARADPHAVNADGTNALYPAAMLSSFRVMRHFINMGVAFEDRRDSVYGFTLMHAAALSADEAKLEWLADNGLELDDPGSCGVTPLHLAAMVGNAAVVRKLIDRGASVHRRDSAWRCTPLHLAAMRGGFLSVRDFKARASDEPDRSSVISHFFDLLDFKTSPRTDYKSALVALLAAGAKVNVRDARGRTPLHYATQRLYGNVVDILLAAGAHVDIQDTEGLTPLHNCLLVGWGLDPLIASGADINDVEHPSRDILREIASEKNEAKCYAISKQLRKLEAAGLPIGRACETWDRDSGDKHILWYVRGECGVEVAQMKKYMLTSDVSVYDLLHMKSKRRLMVVEHLPSDLQRKFPYLYPMIRGCYQEAVVRESMLKSAKEAYQFITGYHWPDLCVDCIFSFLSNKSLRALIDSAIESSAENIDLEKLSIQFHEIEC